MAPSRKGSNLSKHPPNQTQSNCTIPPLRDLLPKTYYEVVDLNE